MKTIITLLICAVSITAFGQDSTGDHKAAILKMLNSISHSSPCKEMQRKGLLIACPEDYPVATYESPILGGYFPLQNSDTLEITDTAIHFIKIGGKVYEIKRNVELVPALQKIDLSMLGGMHLTMPQIDTTGIFGVPYVQPFDRHAILHIVNQ